MRHRKQNTKFGRSKSHREALIPMLVVGLVKAMSIQTTVQKAKVARQLADQMVTLARKNDFNARRRAEPHGTQGIRARMHCTRVTGDGEILR